MFFYPFQSQTDNGTNNTSGINKNQSISCLPEFILDKNEISLITKNYVCKPKIMNLVSSENISDYLSDELPGNEIVWNDWKNYPPLVEKVNELIKDKTNDLDKVKAITNWVHKSKDYSCSIFPPPPGLENCTHTPANSDAKFSYIFDSDKGVCMDAAIITSAMLRKAGIPSIPRKIDINHIVTMYFLDNIWYSVDTTFCFDKTKCPDLSFMSLEDAKQTIYFLDNRIGHFKNSKGKYCENDFCLDHPFVTNKIMPLNNKSFQTSVFYPAIRNVNIDGIQVSCSIEFKDMICASNGCQFFIVGNAAFDQIPIGSTEPLLESEWNRAYPILYEIEDMKNVGYNQILLPSQIKFLAINDEPAQIKKITYRYVCKQFLNYRPIAYKEFSLNKGEKLVINYSDLQKSDEATDKEFINLINEIKSKTFSLGINP